MDPIRMILWRTPFSLYQSIEGSEALASPSDNDRFTENEVEDVYGGMVLRCTFVNVAHEGIDWMPALTGEDPA
jgi:hypothetical protein